jgi:hypothetical protein
MLGVVGDEFGSQEKITSIAQAPSEDAIYLAISIEAGAWFALLRQA